MKYVKVSIAFALSMAGLLMPWRTRLLFSELLGWAAQILPPATYEVTHRDEEPPGP